MNVSRIAAALRALADAIEAPTDQVAGPTGAPPAPKPRGRPPKGEGAPIVASGAAVPAPAASPAITTAGPVGAVPSAAPTAAGTAANLTYAALAPLFLASARAHKRQFVVDCMKKFGAEAFDKVPLAKLPEFKLMLEAGPQPVTIADDVTDLMG